MTRIAATFDTLAAEGYLLARVDSGQADTVIATWGPPAVVRSVQVIGAAALLEPTGGWRTREGARFRRADLVRDLARTAAA